MNQDQDGWRRGARLRQLPNKTTTTQDQTAQAPQNARKTAGKRKRGRPAAAAAESQQQTQQPHQQQQQQQLPKQFQPLAQQQVQNQIPLQQTEDQDEEEGGGQPAPKKQATRNSDIQAQPTQNQPKNTRKGEPVQHWLQNLQWPEHLFVSDMDQVKHLRRETTDETPARPSKTSAYTGQKCPLFLKARGSYLGPHKDGIAQEDQQMCVALLARECDTPRGMILDDATFPYLQHRILERNEKAVVILLGQALVPSAEIEKLRGNVVFDGFIDTINESWTGWVPLHADTEPATEKQRAQQQEQLPRPQPDYSVGFLHEAFGDARLRKLTPLLAGIGDNSLFKGTLEMLFPFLTAEAKSAKRTLLEASHQNAHSMTCALRGVVKLFQLVKREAELHRRILGFSCAYDHERVQWYGHYVAVREDDSKITYHRHEIETLSLKARNGRDRWASYKLALAVYNDWVPKHLERLCSAIDDLPDNISFDVDPDPTPQVAADGDGIVES